ncbi:uncharacterized protein BYT42DRAFT_589506 [Radiomyces spectabilis]|uniref:uncharacterized protein n=1 Tax=Radiomyces spectabilis TaxID=64574 RepID=UPI0022208E74|nr:uncharacterized protein BYT42DRAFT_589506 [Radiomyces spectabilis]KAI8365312.1 hypothetical protein BYT42DRAFT_589506 [Radiomyces spectabilis]
MPCFPFFFVSWLFRSLFAGIIAVGTKTFRLNSFHISIKNRAKKNPRRNNLG